MQRYLISSGTILRFAVSKSEYRKELIITYTLWGFLGVWGVHRFYHGRWITGLMYIATGAFCGFGMLFDLFYNPTMVRESR